MTNKTKHLYSRQSKPGFKAYSEMVPEFRPYLMHANTTNYRSKVVNTDRLGFRNIYYKEKLLGIDQLKKNSKNINLLIGTSAAFGMGSNSDKTTIQSFLSSSGELCFSLGIRGGNSQQELLSFLKFKNFFPKIKNIIIFSGLNDIQQSAQKNSFHYKDYGGLSGAETHIFNSLLQVNSFSKEKWVLGKTNLFFIINYLSNRFSIFRFFLRIFSFFRMSKLQKKTHNDSILNFKEKNNDIKKIIANDLHTWSLIQNQMQIRIIYLFQPTITWTSRKPTDYEKQIIKFEKKRINEYFQKDFTSRKVYLDTKNFLKKECKKNSIDFYDANKLILNSDKKRDFFIDFVHLSNYGNEYIASVIDKILLKKL
ncbi:hypothetical protein OAM08_01120 [Pelagibacteraceae bacterium]|nr:hypothetical protein [Pelagibacteraceae bacterium]